MNSPCSSKSEDIVLEQLLEYCSGLSIYVSSSISPKRVQGRGLGIYATGAVSRGEKLMHVPTSALLTTDSIPSSFAGQDSRSSISVHGLLAAYLAFGLESHREREYGPWMATWPTLSDFTTTMPMFWPVESTQSQTRPEQSHRPVKRKRIRKDPPNCETQNDRTAHFTMPPAITGRRTTMRANSVGLSQKQTSEFGQCIRMLAEHLPSQAGQISDPVHPDYWKYVYMWSCVNTRCFFYVKPGTKEPADSNEAMALCPGMDLFNHSDAEGCETKYDEDGYSITAKRDYAVGEEVLLNYGAHNNDVLWTEYGFMLDENSEDGIQIDDIVMQGLNTQQREDLESAGYLGDYWLKAEGLCWRTEVVAWLHILDSQPNQWQKLVDGIWTPTPTANEAQVLQAKRMQVEWMLQVRREAEDSLRWVSSMTNGQILDCLADSVATLTAQDDGNTSAVPLNELRKKQSRERHSMCVKRWKQIFELCTAAIRTIENECTGAFVTGQKGRRKENLDWSIEDFLGMEPH